VTTIDCTDEKSRSEICSLGPLKLRFGTRQCLTIRTNPTTPISVEVFEDVPLRDRLPCLGKHLVPVLHFDRAALGTEHQLTDCLIATHAIVVHDADDQRRLSNAFVRHVKRERVVERRIQCLLLYLRLLLFRLLSFVHHPDLHVWICNSSRINPINFTRERADGSQLRGPSKQESKKVSTFVFVWQSSGNDVKSFVH